MVGVPCDPHMVGVPCDPLVGVPCDPTVIATTDRDFRRFSGIQAINPLDEDASA